MQGINRANDNWSFASGILWLRIISLACDRMNTYYVSTYLVNLQKSDAPAQTSPFFREIWLGVRFSRLFSWLLRPLCTWGLIPYQVDSLFVVISMVNWVWLKLKPTNAPISNVNSHVFRSGTRRSEIYPVAPITIRLSIPITVVATLKSGMDIVDEASLIRVFVEERLSSRISLVVMYLEAKFLYFSSPWFLGCIFIEIFSLKLVPAKLWSSLKDWRENHDHLTMSLRGNAMQLTVKVNHPLWLCVSSNVKWDITWIVDHLYSIIMQLYSHFFNQYRDIRRIFDCHVGLCSCTVSHLMGSGDPVIVHKDLVFQVIES